MSNFESLGELVATRRRSLGISQSELQRRAGLSSPSIVSRLESGAIPTVESMRMIARALGAESRLMEAYQRAIERQPGGMAREFSLASVQTLLAAPFALLEVDDLVIATARQSDEGDGRQSLACGEDDLPLDRRAIHEILAGHLVDCVVTFRSSFAQDNPVPSSNQPDPTRRSEGRAAAVTWPSDETETTDNSARHLRDRLSVGPDFRGESKVDSRLIIGTLACEFVSDGVDVLVESGVGNSDSPLTTQYVTDLSRLLMDGRRPRDQRSFPLRIAGDEASMLHASGQLGVGPSLRWAANSSQEKAYRLSVEPETSRKLPDVASQRGSCLGSSRTLFLDLDVIATSSTTFAREQSRFAKLLDQLALKAGSLSTSSLTTDRLPPNSILWQIARVFDTTADVVSDFLRRAKPKWRTLLSPVWLEGHRSMRRSTL